jgi:peptidoglycan glycosyltransferase
MGHFFAFVDPRAEAGDVKRHLEPTRTARLRRTPSVDARLSQVVQTTVRSLPLSVPLVAGMLCAGLIHAAASEPALAEGTAQEAAPGLAAPVEGTFPPGDGASPNPQRTAPTVGSPLTAEAGEPDGFGQAASVVDAVPAAVKGKSDGPARPTRDADLERRIQRLLVEGRTPFGAVVVLDAHNGHIVAVAEHSTRASAAGLALRPVAPAASVFKIVTSRALLASGVDADDEVCFHGGRTRMTARLLKDDNRRDHCIPFGDVLPKSANVAIAKLAGRRLTPAVLRAEAARWGFGVPLLDVAGFSPSTAVIPEESFAFAEAAAGFGDVKISAMHGAVIASIVAHDGVLLRPTLDASLEPEAPVQVIPAAHARALKKMLTATVVDGTAKRAFRQGPRLGTTAAGKTGSLTDYDTGLDTSWFVGFAPAQAPQFIVSAMVVNTSKWHIKAPWLAKEALRLAFEERGATRSVGRVATR